MDADTGKFYFIEVNPRIQVEHTVTEQVTGIDIVKAQIHILDGFAIGTPESGVPAQEDIRLNGHALQCRITTEDPEQNFIPDYGRITAYRGATGFGIRLDGGTAYSGAVITRFYDPLLEKVTAWAPTPEEAIARMHRALREFRIRGVATNLTFLEAIITHPSFRDNSYTTRFIDTTPELFAQVKRQDRATKLLNYLADVTRQRPSRDARPADAQGRRRRARSCPISNGNVPDGTQAAARRARPGGVRRLDARAEAGAGHRHDDARRPPVAARDAHAHARHRRHRRRLCARAAAAAVARMLGRRDLRRRHALPHRGPVGAAAPWCARRRPTSCCRCCCAAPTASATPTIPTMSCSISSSRRPRGGIDLFRVFDCLNWVENMRVSMDAVRRRGQALRGGDLLHRRHPRPGPRQIRPQILCRPGQANWRRPAPTSSRVKDMAGLLKPAAARVLFKALREATDLPIHFHTHDTSGLSAATVLAAVESGVDAVDAAMDALLRQHLAALPRLDRRGAEGHRARSRPRPGVRSARSRSTGRRCATSTPPSRATSRARPRKSICTRCRAGSSPTSRSRRARSGSRRAGTRSRRPMHDVNLMFGDIVKVTPSSKVVGDMALMMVSQDLTVADVENPAKDIAFPDSVVVDAARRSRPAARRLARGAAEEGAEGREADHRAAGLAAQAGRSRGRAARRSRRSSGASSTSSSSPPS